MTETKKAAKAPARAYAESVLPMIASKYIASKLVESLANNGVSPENVAPEAIDDPHKAVMLDAGNLLHLRMLFDEDFPHKDALRAAVLPPILDYGKMDGCAKDGDEGADDRRSIRRLAGVSVGLLDELIRVYTHELSHLKAGETFGGKGEISVMVMPEMRAVGDGYGVAMNLIGGRCRFEHPLTSEQRAVINVAGHMGEKLCTSIKNSDGAPARDVDYWYKIFADVYAAGDPEKASEDKPVFHSGAWQDVSGFYECAPTEEERRDAIAKAGEIIIEHWADILAGAAYRAIRHLTVMGDVVTLMTSAMEMAEAAAAGTYSEVLVTVVAVPPPKDEDE